MLSAKKHFCLFTELKKETKYGLPQKKNKPILDDIGQGKTWAEKPVDPSKILKISPRQCSPCLLRMGLFSKFFKTKEILAVFLYS